MATLEKIRSRAGLLVGVVGLALFAFIIGDFLRSGSTFFRQSKEKIAVVDGQSIGIREFQSEEETAVNNYKNNAGGSLTEEQQNQVRQMVFERMVGKILLSEESKRIGFVVSEEELADLVMGNNISPMIQQISFFKNPQTNAFDKNLLIRFLQQIESDDWSMYSPEDQQQLQNSKGIWLNIEQTVAEQKLLEKFSSLLISSVVANSLDAKAAFNDNSVNVDFDYAVQPYTSIPDTAIAVSDAEIAKLYELRKSSFKQEHAKIISYIAVNILPSEADYADVSAQMEKLKDELANTTNPTDLISDNSDEPFLDAYVSGDQLSGEMRNFAEHASVGAVAGPFLTNQTYDVYKLLDVREAPDSIKMNQISFPTTDEAAIKPVIDSLIHVIHSGKSFADVALDATNKQFNGDIGWQTEMSLYKNSGVKFTNLSALFDAKVNDLFTVKSSYGIHLVQIVEKTKPVKKYKIGEIKKEVTPSAETYNKIYNNLNQYIVKNNNLERFKSAASDAGYICQTDVQVLENQGNIASIENSRPVIRWAFGANKGSISDIFECQNRTYFIAAVVEGELKAGFRPLKDVSDILKRELINEKKGAKIVETLKAGNYNSLDSYATAMNSTVQEVKFVTFATPRITGIGSDPAVNARAVTSEVGQISGPFAGRYAVYVLATTAKNTNDQKYDEAIQKRQMNMQNSYRIMQKAQDFSVLKDKAAIEDNRSRFY
ncbi:MAG: SurA N-terminal domain-containing protein [Candidatus Azobacteroides sp.]|nr:SurA N-terminal domain-containing protein [Candidatus Azobacteroides sp.]